MWEREQWGCSILLVISRKRKVSVWRHYSKYLDKGMYRTGSLPLGGNTSGRILKLGLSQMSLGRIDLVMIALALAY